MKKSAENRYPHSAELFRFCKEALNIKHNFEVKVIDQHVGAILGYDPADCSHWKKGKKNIKSLQTVNTIASHLEIDSRFVTDIISGKSDLEESLQEFRGYGPFAVSGRYHDEVKREFFRNPSKFQSVGETRSFEQVTSPHREESLRITTEILARADVRTCPVRLPELAVALAGTIRLEQAGDAAFDDPSQLRPFGEGRLVESVSDGRIITIRYRGGEMKPHLRTLIARELGRTLLLGAPGQIPSGTTLPDNETDELACARINVFAGLLLVPGDLLQRATRLVNPARDIVSQLSEIFWVGRTVMTARMKDFVEHGN